MGITGEIQIGPPADEAEVRAYAHVVSQALFAPEIDLDAWTDREGSENIRIARREGQVIGGLIVQRMGQWFGGRSVPTAGVRAVGVASEHRAAGVASRLLREMLEECHREGIPLSTLFPATQPLYRRIGYEQAGVHLLHRLPIHGIDVRDRLLALRRVEPSDHEAIRHAYTEHARRSSGNLDRNAWMWRRILDRAPWQPPVHGYLVERDGSVEGYAFLVQKSVDPLRNMHELEAVDLVSLTADAARRLLTFFSDHSSMTRDVSFHGSPVEPMLSQLSEQVSTVVDRTNWMLRIVDVLGALEKRSYPPGVEAELHLNVADDVLPHNHKRIVLDVSDSQGRVREGGQGNLHIDIRGLATLYAAHMSPYALKIAGYLDASDKDLAAAAAVFNGPAPWMPDIF